jgi:hypothetical protein
MFLKKGVFMSLNNSTNLDEGPLRKRTFLQNHPKMTTFTFKVQRWVPVKKEKAHSPSGKNVTVYFYDVLKDALDLKKNQNAPLPNSKHHIDAEILFLTISKLLQKNRPILAIHDGYSIIGPLSMYRHRINLALWHRTIMKHYEAL